jgi:hypothetical protein
MFTLQNTLWKYKKERRLLVRDIFTADFRWQHLSNGDTTFVVTILSGLPSTEYF